MTCSTLLSTNRNDEDVVLDLETGTTGPCWQYEKVRQVRGGS